ncbi:MAG: hypothetical protein ABJB86_22380 [Bacteroidota bacterium]
MLIEIVLLLTTFYLFCGLVFAIVFVLQGLAVVDKGARGSSIGFKIIILPGIVLLWPVLLKKWINAKSTSHDEAP